MSKPEGFVEARLRGVPFYLNLETHEFVNKNWFTGILFNIVLFWLERVVQSEFIDFEIRCNEACDYDQCCKFVEQAEKGEDGNLHTNL